MECGVWGGELWGVLVIFNIMERPYYSEGDEVTYWRCDNLFISFVYTISFLLGVFLLGLFPLNVFLFGLFLCLYFLFSYFFLLYFFFLLDISGELLAGYFIGDAAVVLLARGRCVFLWSFVHSREFGEGHPCRFILHRSPSIPSAFT